MLAAAQPADEGRLRLLHEVSRRGRGVRAFEDPDAARRPERCDLPSSGDPRRQRPPFPTGAGRAHRARGTQRDAAPLSGGQPRLQQHPVQVPAGDGRLDARAFAVTDFDVVVAGAGHNSLVTAAYLARAGLRVLVLERASRIGGDTSTEEVTLPGYRHDLCASAHTIFQSSPIVRNDELELGRHGLRYLFPDPVVVMPFTDGRGIVMHRDRARTIREIERFSAHDARAYARMLDDWDQIKESQNRARYSPATTPSDAIAALEATPPGVEAVRWRYSSALDTVRERFDDERVRAFFVWLSPMTMARCEEPGTGLLPLAIAAGRQAFSWTTAEGGSVALPEALARIVVEHGGQVRTGAEVTRVLFEDGRAAGVVTADGAG